MTNKQFVISINYLAQISIMGNGDKQSRNRMQS